MEKSYWQSPDGEVRWIDCDDDGETTISYDCLTELLRQAGWVPVDR